MSTAPGDFERQLASRGKGGVISDFWHLLRRTRKWWLGPLMLLMLALGALMLLSGTAVAPFIYTLF